MELRSPADHIWFTTAHLECRGSKGRSSGTGFFIQVPMRNLKSGEEGPATMLVTNGHVVRAANDRIEIGTVLGEKSPDGVMRPVLGASAGVEIDNPHEVFHFHPDPEIDVAVLSFAGYAENLRQAAEGRSVEAPIAVVGASSMLSPEIEDELDSFEQVLVVGYPNGLFDTANLTPVLRSGYTASPVRLNYQGRPTFLIDAPIFPGSSGSPVFLLERMGSVSARFGATGRVILLGVVAEAHTIRGSFHVGGEKRPKNAATLMNLGIVFKASTIVECIDAALASEGWERV